jgi:hypothetical protein
MGALDYRKQHFSELSKISGKLSQIGTFLTRLPVPTDDNGQKAQLESDLQTLQTAVNHRKGRVSQSTARVSVIGLEKQGKSTFVNAWIGKQCLPSDSKRCTWASSTLVNDTKFYAKIRFLTTEEFIRTVDGLFESLNLSKSEFRFPLLVNFKDNEQVKKVSDNPAFKDLEQLSQYYGEIKHNLDRGILEINSDDVKDFNQKLFEWVSLRKTDGTENGKAYSVAHCDIHLPIQEGLLFSVDDLPGIDAPGNRAETMTWNNVEQNADIIVLVKNAVNNASMNSNEIKIWDKASKSDSSIKLTERLFVALNQADYDKTEHGRDCHEEAFKEFRSKSVPEKRIFYVSSRAELYGTTKDKSTLSFTDWTEEDYKDAISKIAKKRSQENLTTGFGEFKAELYRFLESDFQALEEKALNFLRDEYSAFFDKYKSFLALYNETDGDEHYLDEKARERFGELWYPQDYGVRDTKGLAVEIRNTIGRMVAAIDVEPEKTKEFLDSIRDLIKNSCTRLSKLNTVEAFECEYNPTVSPIKDYDKMKSSYCERLHGKAKKEIFNKLSTEISQNINSHIKAIWDAGLSAHNPEAPKGLLAISEKTITEFLKKQYPDALFSNFDNSELGRIPYGFTALLKSIAHPAVEYLMSYNTMLQTQRTNILYKADLFCKSTNSGYLGFELRRNYDTAFRNSKNPTTAYAAVIKLLKENTDYLRIATDILLPKPFGIIADIILNSIDKTPDTQKTDIGVPTTAAGNPFGKSITNGTPVSNSGENTILDESMNTITPEKVVEEIGQRIKLVYFVLESMLFDNDFGIIGYYRAILEEFRLLVGDEMFNDGAVIKSLAFHNSEYIFPNEMLFKHDNEREQLQRIIQEAFEVEK